MSAKMDLTANRSLIATHYSLLITDYSITHYSFPDDLANPHGQFIHRFSAIIDCW
jgi:hypothetical protein